MKRTTKRICFLLFSAALISSYLGGCRNQLVDAVPPFSLDMEEVRALAGDVNLPNKILRYKIGTGIFPCFWKVAGKCVDGEIDFSTFAITYANSLSIIDPVHDLDLHDKFLFSGDYNSDAFIKMQEAMSGAHQIYFTHEHWDHCAGAFRSQHYDRIHDKILVSDSQLKSKLLKYSLTSDTQDISSISAVTFEKYFTPYPGVVFIKAEGHTPGSQMIYVRLEDGNEYLFVGDIVYSMDNIKLEISKPLFTSIINAENSELVTGQLKLLSQLHKNTDINIVVAHDRQNTNEMVRMGLIDDLDNADLEGNFSVR